MSEELAHHGYKIRPGSLYPTLHKMEEDGARFAHRVCRRSFAPEPRGDRQGCRYLEETIVQLHELAREVLGEETT
jgi:DNA-binding PadR family transcriptional regulator